MPAETDGEVLWEPDPDAVRQAAMTRYMTWLADHRGLRFSSYADLWRWSVEDLEGFWGSIWDFFEVRGSRPSERVLAARDMPGAEWFPGARLSYAEHALRAPGGAEAIVARSEARGDATVRLTYAELAQQVAAAREGMRRAGVGRGDRVVAYLPNLPETVVAFLAAASLGAVWSSCSPDFGTRAVVDRFRQIEPRLLLAVDGYSYAGKAHDRRSDVDDIRASIPSLETTVTIPLLDARGAPGAGCISWESLLGGGGEPAYEQLPFDHPLWVLYSSGTTGLPKGIVHGQGGILLEHLKAAVLHQDLGPGDRFFWFTTTGWMMWNFLVGGLLAGTTLVLYDGSPGHPDMGALWRLAAETGVTYFGTSAPFIQACMKAGVRPGDQADLHALRGLGSTGAPLPPEGFRWILDAVKPGLHIGSVSGGTDVCTAFVQSCPLLPVRAGELQCAALGARVEAWDDEGRSVVDEVGELVITEPMPSMPIRFWNDPEGKRLRESYFEPYPGVWRHGDWIRMTRHGGAVIYGRSDSTLNRGGVRMGTSEFYRVVEELPEVADSLVVDLGGPGGDDRLLLFVVPAPGVELDEAARSRISAALRRQLSPRHVPDEVHAVAAIPRTLNGKKLEVPVKRILQGVDPARAVSAGAVADPAALEYFVRMTRRAVR